MQAVTIAGGGLAGLSLGIALRKRGVPVVLHEAGNYPRHRVCGEFICGVSDDVLTTLGIEDCFEGAIECRSTTWFFKGCPVYQKTLPLPAKGISRYLLDERLAHRFTELEGELYTGSRLKENELLDEGTVCAVGRKASGNDWLGLKFHVSGLELSADLELHLGAGGYMGLSRIEDGKVNACGLFRRRSEVSSPRQQLPFAYLEACGLGYLSERVESAQVDEASISGVSALGYHRGAEAGELIFSIGDYTGLIPPFTGNGMSMAFESAVLALETLKHWANDEMGWSQARTESKQRQQKAFGRRKQIARLLHPLIFRSQGQFALSLFARSRLLPFTPLFNLTH